MTLRETLSVAASAHSFRAPSATPRERLAPLVGVLLALQVALLSVPTLTLPRIDLDSGWQYGLVVAIAEGRRFGHDIVFTYGPWAQLDIITPVRFLYVLVGFLGTLVTAVALVGVSWTLARSWLSARDSAVLTLLTVTPAAAFGAPFSGRVLLLAVLILVGAVTGSLPKSWHRWVFTAVAAFSALALETKFSNGTLAIATTLAAAAIASPADLRLRARRVLTALAVVILLGVVFWLAAGQSLTDLPSWISTSIEVTKGYADGMATEYGPVGEYTIFGIVVVLLGFSLVRRRTRWGVLWTVLVLAWVTLMGLRLGFTRHDSGHVVQVFVLLLVAFVATRVTKHVWLPVVGAGLSTALAFGLASSGQTYFDSVDPGRWGRSSVTLVTDLVSKQDRDESLEKAYTGLRNATKLPESVLEALRGKTVAVDPWDVTVALAYNLTWQPVPVIQTYSAYTPRLDRINADALASPGAPQAILRKSSQSIDYRNSIWESPAYMVSMLCHYRPVVQSGIWMVLYRSTNRCGDPTVLSTQTLTADQPIAVPDAPDDHSMVVASFDLERSLGERLQETIFKPVDEEYLSVSPQAKYRVPRAQLGGPFLLNIPASSGWTAAFGGWTPYPQISAPQDGTVTFSVIELTS